LKGKANGKWELVSNKESGLFIKGEVRDLKILNIEAARFVVITRNNSSLQFLKY
jgi:hypothetical protein